MKNRVIIALSSAILFCNLTSKVNAFDGFYTGAALGGTFSSGSENSIFSLVPTPDTNTRGFIVNSKHGFKKNGVIGNLFIGYGELCDPLYLGAEAFALWSKLRDNTAVSALNTRGLLFTTEGSINNRSLKYGIDLRPGYLLTENSLIYARLGVAYTKVNLNNFMAVNFDQNVGGNVVSTLRLSGINHASKNLVSCRIGLGIEQMITCNLSLRADFVHVRHKTLNLINTTTRQSGPDTITITTMTNIKVSNNTAMIGLAYYW